MKMGIRETPPSRQNKKQIIAHADPALVEAAHRKAEKEDVTLQELIALSVNASVSEYGRSPFLKVTRDRLVRRKKAPAKVLTEGPDCRTGTRRIAAWFDRNDHEQVAMFAKEVGVSIEHLVLKGLPGVLKRPVPAPVTSHQAAAAAAAAASAVEAERRAA
jgi:predicted HicB family RNase H-like nuclease